jgi:hypothetical protein
MDHLRFTPIRRMSACQALGLMVAAGLLVSGCAMSSGHLPAKTAPACGTVPTPATTLTIPDRISTAAEQATCNQLHDLTAIYQQAGEAAQITGTISGVIPRTSSQISAAQERVKALCFQIERALWTSGIPVQDVTVTILGPVFDDYFDQIISWYGTAALAAKAAAQVDWHSVSADQAWDMFAQTSLRVDYDSFQLWGQTPSASPSSGNS